MKDDIQIAIGACVSDIGMMQFWLHDQGLKIDQDMTREDIELAIAVMRDAADALETQLERMKQH